MDVKLTKDAEYLLGALYANYLNQRKGGKDKDAAKFTGSSKQIHETVMREWSFADVDETCRELSRAHMLNCQYADDVTWNSRLTDEAIIYMENRFGGKVGEVLGWMAKIKDAIPFV